MEHEKATLLKINSYKIYIGLVIFVKFD